MVYSTHEVSKKRQMLRKAHVVIFTPAFGGYGYPLRISKKDALTLVGVEELNWQLDAEGFLWISR
jgi:hypothetical protein